MIDESVLAPGRTVSPSLVSKLERTANSTRWSQLRTLAAKENIVGQGQQLKSDSKGISFYAVVV